MTSVMWYPDVNLPEMNQLHPEHTTPLYENKDAKKKKWGDSSASVKDHGFVDCFDVNSPGLLRAILFYKQGKHLGNSFSRLRS